MCTSETEKSSFAGSLSPKTCGQVASIRSAETIFSTSGTDTLWRSPESAFFQIRTKDGNRYVLRHEESVDKWTLQSDFEGTELLVRSSIELVRVEPKVSLEAESRIAGYERCHPEESELLFDSIVSDVLDKHGAFEFVLAEPARCPNCSGEITEKTLVELEGGMDVEASAFSPE